MLCKQQFLNFQIQHLVVSGIAKDGDKERNNIWNTQRCEAFMIGRMRDILINGCCSTMGAGVDGLGGIGEQSIGSGKTS